MRSAKAPVISAGVITANMHWKIMNTTCGMVVAYVALGSESTPARANQDRSPTTPATSGPKDMD